ncbi:hypothetical protein [Agrococcus beijingensis]|uniref:hypothetical protein n=1 Tax=Agrococcus beijingensis TaxID=3068634 RepID=UPI002740A5F9|nr:hypothetical protein [Agrococcus sp. REN33]
MSHHDDHQHDHDAGDDGTKKPGGLGDDGTIPNEPDGLGATTTDEESTFEPEEDEQADPDLPS